MRTTEIKTQARTKQQNKALHVLFRHLADELNRQGLDMRRTLKPDVDIPWTETTVKEHLWRPVQEAQLMKSSTTKLTTTEVDEVFNTINRHLADRLGVHVDFPSIESLITREEIR